jgi:hypothetical protein
MSFQVWPDSTNRQRRAFRRLLARYLDLTRQLAQQAGGVSLFDKVTGRLFTGDMLAQWNFGR